MDREYRGRSESDLEYYMRGPSHPQDGDRLDRLEGFRRRSRSPPYSDPRHSFPPKDEPIRRIAADSTPGNGLRRIFSESSSRDQDKSPYPGSPSPYSATPPIRRASSPPYKSGLGNFSNRERALGPSSLNTQSSFREEKLGSNSFGPHTPHTPQAPNAPISSSNTPYTPSTATKLGFKTAQHGAPPEIIRNVRQRPIDYSRISEALKYSWNEREEKEFEKAHLDRKKMACDDYQQLGELRKAYIEAALADLEVSRWEVQLNLLTKQIEENDAILQELNKVA
ncbi:hypothetical protein HDU97_005044 [Phlyctochytrium planicorne]|nr:hypothetical protein HDU97_005044 [Phlyctochytrium planicorne]